ncbi:polypeptide N-acetylgalactosaminyltransferase 18-like [Oncorhynchus masou masou]|uniref:polypeptide N-acetylgalactosaminyltransferase 18-like n=1 Tax=Oncorhynchus masou masou TaxID=90313 RepID=UPI0031838112
MKRNALRVAEVCMDEYKHNVNITWNLPLKNCYYRASEEIHIGAIKSHKYNSNCCLVDIGTQTPGLYDCKEAKQKGFHMLWEFQQGKAIQNRQTKRCLEIAPGEDTFYQLIIQECSGQHWLIRNVIKDF